MEVLDLGDAHQGVDAATLRLLGAKCNNLKDLKFTSFNNSPEVLASALGPGKFPRLEKIQITSIRRPLNDKVVLALCASHSNLESIQLAGCSSVTLSSIAVALTHCPRFKELDTEGFQFTLLAKHHSNPTHLLYYTFIVKDGSLLKVVNCSVVFRAIVEAPFYTHKVGAFEIATDEKIANKEVQEIIDAFGGHIRVLNIVLGDDVTHQTLERLCRECTELRTLHLFKCAVLTDDLVMALADYCHQVIYLSLSGAVNITNLSMCYLLQCMGHRLRSLYIDQCILLTESTLIAVIQHCVELETLSFAETSITAEAVITHVVKANSLPMLEELIADPETMRRLSDECHGWTME